MLGKTFTARGLAALAGGDEAELDPLLDDLVRKELLYVDTDPFSPERGQYGFLQALVQRVAYDTLSRRDRKAQAPRRGAPPRRERPGSSRTRSPRSSPRTTSTRSARTSDADDARGRSARARAAGSSERRSARPRSAAARRGAARLRERGGARRRPVERARSSSERASMARMGNRMDDAERLFTRARELYTGGGRRRMPSARSAAGLAHALRVPTAGRRTRSGSPRKPTNVLGADEPGPRRARRSRRSWRVCTSSSATTTPRWRGSRAALEIAERTKDMALLASALNTKSMLCSVDRPHEAYALVQARARDRARSRPRVRGAARLQQPSWSSSSVLDRSEETLPLLEEALALARRRGDRSGSTLLTAASDHRAPSITGRWDEAEALAQELRTRSRRTSAPSQAYARSRSRSHGSEATRAESSELGSTASPPLGRRGRPAAASRLLTARGERAASSTQGSFDEALDCGRDGGRTSSSSNRSRTCFVAIGASRGGVARAARGGSLAGRAHARVPSRMPSPRSTLHAPSPRTTARLDGVLASLRGDHDDGGRAVRDRSRRSSEPRLRSLGR